MNTENNKTDYYMVPIEFIKLATDFYIQPKHKKECYGFYLNQCVCGMDKKQIRFQELMEDEVKHMNNTEEPIEIVKTIGKIVGADSTLKLVEIQLTTPVSGVKMGDDIKVEFKKYKI